MDYLLMKANREAARFSIINLKSSPEIILKEVIDFDEVPLHIKYAGTERITEFQSWIRHRIIPDNRQDITGFMMEIPFQNVLEASLASYSLSLSDPYWIKPAKSNLSWDTVNFYKNSFSHDAGNIMFGFHASKKPDFTTPDFTTNGWLKKTWRKKKNETYLIKQGSSPEGWEAANEVFASRLINKISPGLCTEYELTEIGGHICSVCKNFLNNGIEFVPAFSVYRTAERPFYSTVLEHLLDRCKEFHIPGAKKFISSMITADYLICNTDRHMGNFGFLRDIETKKFIGPAPLFDNGTSLWNKVPIKPNPDIELLKFDSPFADGHDMRLLYLENAENWIIDDNFVKEEKEELESILDSIRLKKENTEIIVSKFEERAIQFQQQIYLAKEEGRNISKLKKEQFVHRSYEYER